METPTLVMNHHPTGYPYDRRTDPYGTATTPRVPDFRSPGDDWAGPPLPVGAEMRNDIARRVVDANFEHAKAAWARRRSDPIGPHVTIYLYRSGPALRLAYRVFLAADEPRLAHLLHELVPHVRRQLDAGVDVRDGQCTTVEEGMRPDAVYLGVAVSSLDTPAGRWADAHRTAHSELHLPGRCYVWLVDDTVLVIDRLASDQFGRVTVHTNEPVRARPGDVGHPLVTVAELAIPHRQTVADPDLLTWLREWHHTVAAHATFPTGGRHGR